MPKTWLVLSSGLPPEQGVHVPPQAVFTADPYLVSRLSENKAALEGRLFVFASPDRKLVIMSRLGSSDLLLDGPGGQERVLKLPFEEFDGKYVMGLALGFAPDGERRKVTGHLILWEGDVPMRFPGDVFVIDDHAEIEHPANRRRAVAAGLTQFWLRAAPEFGDMPWRLSRYAYAPLEMVGSKMSFLPSNTPRVGDDPLPPMIPGEIVAISRFADTQLVYLLRRACGEVIEIFQSPTAWHRRVKGVLDPVMVTFPSA